MDTVFLDISILTWIWYIVQSCTDWWYTVRVHDSDRERPWSAYIHYILFSVSVHTRACVYVCTHNVFVPVLLCLYLWLHTSHSCVCKYAIGGTCAKACERRWATPMPAANQHLHRAKAKPFFRQGGAPPCDWQASRRPDWGVYGVMTAGVWSEEPRQKSCTADPDSCVAWRLVSARSPSI